MPNDGRDRFTRLTGAVAALHGLLAVLALAGAAHGGAIAGASGLLQRGGQIEIYHALAVFAALCIGARGPAVLFAAGAALFAWPLYVHALSGSAALVLLAPVGGLTLLAGWAWLLWTLLRPGWRHA